MTSKTYERHGWEVHKVGTRHWIASTWLFGHGDTRQMREHFTTRREAYQFIDVFHRRQGEMIDGQVCYVKRGGAYEYTGRAVRARCPKCGPIGEYPSMTEATAAVRVHRARAAA